MGGVKKTRRTPPAGGRSSRGAEGSLGQRPNVPGAGIT